MSPLLLETMSTPIVGVMPKRRTAAVGGKPIPIWSSVSGVKETEVPESSDPLPLLVRRVAHVDEQDVGAEEPASSQHRRLARVLSRGGGSSRAG